jgi:hypothetical protein
MNTLKNLSALRYQILNKNHFSSSKQKVVLFPGNGIGPEISRSVVDIFSSLKIPIEF